MKEEGFPELEISWNTKKIQWKYLQDQKKIVTKDPIRGVSVRDHMLCL